MNYLTNKAIVAVITIPDSVSTDSVTFTIVRASDGSTFASGNMTYAGGFQWKTTFTPTDEDIYTLNAVHASTDMPYYKEFIVESVASAGSSSVDASSNLGKVRHLILDLGPDFVLTDDSINAFLSMHSNNIFMAAYQSMLAIASSRALLAKRRSAGDYTEDLTAIAKECREAAALFKETAENIPAEAVGEQFYTDFSYRELLTGKVLREELD